MERKVTITHRMADGTICRTKEELRAYLTLDKIPEDITRMIVEIVRTGHEIRMKEQQRKNEQ